MLKFIVYVNTPENAPVNVAGMKEAFAVDCEKYGDVVKVDVEFATPEQLTL